jgi:hypothetical protein
LLSIGLVMARGTVARLSIFIKQMFGFVDRLGGEPFVVMAGLVPAIHAAPPQRGAGHQREKCKSS